MRPLPLADLKGMLADLSDGSDAATEASAVQTLVDRIVDRSRPEMALAALMRWNAPETMPPARREALRERVREALAARRREGVDVPEGAARGQGPGGSWLTVDDVVRDYLTHLRAATLLERLRTWEGRRRLGYPQWDGYRWLISSLAVDPATATEYLAAQPAREPLADLLPPWCERQPDDAVGPAAVPPTTASIEGLPSADAGLTTTRDDAKYSPGARTERTRDVRTRSTPGRKAASGASSTTVRRDAS